MSLKNFLSMQSLASAMSTLKQLEQKLAQHLAEERDVITKEIEEAIAHFKAEIEQLRGKVEPAVVANIDAGMDPHTAFVSAQATEAQAEKV